MRNDLFEKIEALNGEALRLTTDIGDLNERTNAIMDEVVMACAETARNETHLQALVSQSLRAHSEYQMLREARRNLEAHRGEIAVELEGLRLKLYGAMIDELITSLENFTTRLEGGSRTTVPKHIH